MTWGAPVAAQGPLQELPLNDPLVRDSFGAERVAGAAAAQMG
ncbi:MULTISPECIES: hypothetical protein [unclassified Yoonia]|nr:MULTISPECIES: hypothetical protein [unclassified Yoonia]